MTALLSPPWLLMHDRGSTDFILGQCKSHGEDQGRNGLEGLDAAYSLEAARTWWPGYGLLKEGALREKGYERYTAHPLPLGSCECHLAGPPAEELPAWCPETRKGLRAAQLSRPGDVAPAIAMQLPLIAMARPRQLKQLAVCAGAGLAD